MNSHGEIVDQKYQPDRELNCFSWQQSNPSDPKPRPTQYDRVFKTHFKSSLYSLRGVTIVSFDEQ